MTDAIIGRLATLHHLAVRPTSSVLRYVKEPAEASHIARDLDVESVLDGTFQRLGDVIRVSVQLVGGQDRTITWAARYDLRADDMLRFQDEIAQQVTEGLSVRLSPAEQKSLASPITTSPEAYDLYLQARFHWTEHSVRSLRDSLTQGRRLLERAIELDPRSPTRTPCSALSPVLRELQLHGKRPRQSRPRADDGGTGPRDRSSPRRRMGRPGRRIFASRPQSRRRAHVAQSRGTGPELRRRVGHARVCLPLRRPPRACGGFVQTRGGTESNLAPSPLDARAHAAVSRPDP